MANDTDSKLGFVPGSVALSAAKDIASGAVRGISQVIVGHPLDTVKVRLQTQSTEGPQFNGVIDCLRQTIKNEGFMGLYKGAQSPIYMSAFYSAVLFFTYGQSKRIFHDPANQYNGQPIYPFHEMVAIGAFCGTSAASVESPMDLVKAKMQVQYSQYGAHGAYKSSVDCATRLVRQYGILSLYRGYDAALMRNIPGTICYFYSYEHLKHTLSKHSNGELSPLSIVTAGGVAGMIFWSVIFPFDVVKSRLQTDATEESKRKYKNVLDCFRKTYRNEGIWAFYKGYKPCMIRAFPTNAATFLAFEFARSLLGK